MVRNPPANAGDVRDAALIPGSGRSPGKRVWQPTPVFLPRKSQGQSSLLGYSPQGWKRVGHNLATKQHRKVQTFVKKQDEVWHLEARIVNSWLAQDLLTQLPAPSWHEPLACTSQDSPVFLPQSSCGRNQAMIRKAPSKFREKRVSAGERKGGHASRWPDSQHFHRHWKWGRAVSWKAVQGFHRIWVQIPALAVTTG